MVVDIEAALYKAALSELNSIAKDGDLIVAVELAHFLKKLYTHGKLLIVDMHGVENTPIKQFVVISSDGKTAQPNKSKKKDALALIKLVAARLGDWILDYPSALKGVFDVYEQTEQS
jgi:hypothetical protein